ncbi:CAAD domain-containing protein [Cronbergia sp. UHCC 0137]|uniref:CAAD domain-containing protein n=1 Tax=Cronbergia sp. UHCC 0137 TaxID=3110239 RepID=UPI002B1FB3FB|nr:CAAD domain-containing protein [Cronbergia sp. UHCC 0137]MEA5618751.1 CAAD domain-containing protein [Cronbergia sp. UHCC 0137]
METKEQQPASVDSTSPSGVLSLEGTEAKEQPKLPPVNAPEAQWQRIVRQISDFLDAIPDYLGSFVNKNKQALFTIVLIISAVIAVKVALAVLDAIHDLPLLALIFETIGISYAIWFTFRYLLKTESRQELSQMVSSVKQQLIG